MKVINLYGGPGSGKSTTAAGLFFLMRLEGYKVELVTEYAKDLVYEGRLQSTSQLEILAEQYRRLRRLESHGLDYVITDSPLLLARIYSNTVADHDIANHLYSQFQNVGILVNRVKSYKQLGRNQTESEAKAIDDDIKEYIYDLRFSVDGDKHAPKTILDRIKEWNW